MNYKEKLGIFFLQGKNRSQFRKLCNDFSMILGHLAQKVTGKKTFGQALDVVLEAAKAKYIDQPRAEAEKTKLETELLKAKIEEVIRKQESKDMELLQIAAQDAPGIQASMEKRILAFLEKNNAIFGTVEIDSKTYFMLIKKPVSVQPSPERKAKTALSETPGPE